MSTRESSRSPSRISKGSAKSKEKKTGSAKRKGKHSSKKHEDSAASTVSGPPDYIIPLVLTSKTQEIFHCRVDEDITQENPFKLLKKEEIVNDLKVRAAVSDFHPFKSIIMEYPGDELLLVFDRDFKYGQNFYLVATEDAKETILRPPEAITDEEDQEGDGDEYIYKPPSPKTWISLGSELEIEEEMMNQTQSKIKFMISRVHREFGAKVNFSDHNASDVKDGYMECAPYQDKRFSIKLKERDAGIQVVPLIQEKSTQTKWSYPKNACTQYKPREFSEEEKKDCLSSKDMKQFINSVSLRLELSLQQNEIMNAFLDDWKTLSEEESTFGSKSDSHLKEFQSFTDHLYNKDKTISCICWHPKIQGLVAVSVTERLSFEERVTLSSKLLLKPSLILLWSFTDPLHPQLMLECPDDIYCFQFCPTDPNIIAGGCFNGQVVLWDISAYQETLTMKTSTSKNTAPKTVLEPKVSNEPHFVRYCAVSSIEHGHKNVITDLHWLPNYFELSKTGHPFENKRGYCIQLVTSSPDCSVMFWDIRPLKVLNATEKKIMEEKQVPQGVPDTFKHIDLIWRPLIKATIPKAGSAGEYSPMKISFREDHYHCRTLDKLQTQVKEEKSEVVVDYRSLRVLSAKNARALEDVSTNYFAATEDGELVYTDWKLEKDGDTGRLISAKPSHTYTVHDGIVHTLQRSPFLNDTILTVGGWNFAIWREGVTSGPILQSCCSQRRYTAAHWSLSRAGVFYIGKEDGNIEIWDLLEKTHEPSQTQNISTSSITYIKPWIATLKQHFLAVADDYGTLHILEIPWNLRHPSANESASVQNYFEREVKHLEYCEQRKTFRAVEKRMIEQKDLTKKIEISPPVKTHDQIEEEQVSEYESYVKVENTILAGLGLREPESTSSKT
ncbi:dynein axonemal intermediate chain 3 [Rhinophrynus dorsalis]